MNQPEIRVLVVDDDFRVAEIHSSYVEKVPGFTVLGCVHTAAAARRALVELPVDLLLLDVYLPDESGLSLLRDLRATGGHPLDVIVVTAARDAVSITEAVQAGAISYLVKPFGYTVLRDRLEAYCRMRQELARVARVGGADQAGVDQVFAALRPSGSGVLPKNLAPETMSLIRGVLTMADGPLGVGEVAAGAGVSQATARRYLTHLVERGQATMRLRYGSAGRPEHLYSLASRAPAS
ncbi:MAG: response regulator [Actinomycetes bacterium]